MERAGEAMVECRAHVAPEALEGTVYRRDAFGGYVLATPQNTTAWTFLSKPLI
jgi:hypothetical protein